MRKAITITGLIFVLISSSMQGQETDPDVELDPELELRIEPTKSTYSPLEPIVITVSVTNLSDKPQEVSIVLEPSWQYLKIYLIDEGGNRHHVQSGMICCGWAGKRKLTTKPPGNSIEHRILLSPQPGCLVAKPGKYGLLASYSAQPKLLDSKVNSVSIKAVADDENKAFDAYRKSLEMDLEVYLDFVARKKHNVDTFQKVEKQFEAVAASYPNSAYAPWCYYTLGQKAEYGFFSLGKRLKTARSHYELLMKNYRKFPLIADVEHRRAELLFRTGDSEEGKRELKRIGRTERSYASELQIYPPKPKVQK